MSTWQEAAAVAVRAPVQVTATLQVTPTLQVPSQRARVLGCLAGLHRRLLLMLAAV